MENEPVRTSLFKPSCLRSIPSLLRPIPTYILLSKAMNGTFRRFQPDVKVQLAFPLRRLLRKAQSPTLGYRPRSSIRLLTSLHSAADVSFLPLQTKITSIQRQPRKDASGNVTLFFRTKKRQLNADALSYPLRRALS